MKHDSYVVIGPFWRLSFPQRLACLTWSWTVSPKPCSWPRWFSLWWWLHCKGLWVLGSAISSDLLCFSPTSSPSGTVSNTNLRSRSSHTGRCKCSYQNRYNDDIIFNNIILEKIIFWSLILQYIQNRFPIKSLCSTLNRFFFMLNLFCFSCWIQSILFLFQLRFTKTSEQWTKGQVI